jgi:hypothetical protein
MTNTIQIIVYKYARDQKYSCNTLKVKKRNQLANIHDLFWFGGISQIAY